MLRSARALTFTLAALGAAGLATACGGSGTVGSNPGSGSMNPTSGGGDGSSSSGTTASSPASSGGGSSSPGGGSGAPSGGGAGALTYAIKLALDETVTMPVVGDSENKMAILGKVTATIVNGALSATLDFCKVDDQSTGSVQISLPASFASGFPNVTTPSMLQGATVNVPSVTLLAGWKSNNPDSDALPTTMSDPRVVDGDNDGKPGLTAQISGVLSADIYLALRSKTAMMGTSDPSGKLSGPATGLVEMSIIGATNALIPTGLLPAKAGPANQNTFTMVHIDADKTCNDIVSNAATLFP